MEDETPAGAAETEAFEEAGVKGKLSQNCVGLFSYTKVRGKDKDDLPCIVAVYPIKVKELAKDFPERAERKRKWVSRKKAIKMVEEPELKEILRHFSREAA